MKIQKKAEDQFFVPKLLEMLGPWAKSVNHRKKGNLQAISLGMDTKGDLFYPEGYVVNEALDGLERGFEMSGSLMEGWFRTDLTCLNDMDGLVVPEEALEDHHFMGGIYATREEMIDSLLERHGNRIETTNYLELVARVSREEEPYRSVVIPFEE